MDLDALYEVLIDNIDIQIWCNDDDTFNDGIIFEGKLFNSRAVVSPFMYCRVFQIELDAHGKMYVGIEVTD